MLTTSRIRKTLVMTMPGFSDRFKDAIKGASGVGSGIGAMGALGSMRDYASTMDKMNGRNFDNGEVSQGSQEQDQGVMMNEEAAASQFLADKVRQIKNPRETTYDGRTLVDGPKGDKVDPNFLKLIQGRPDLYEKYMAGEDIFGGAPEMKNPYMGT